MTRPLAVVDIDGVVADVRHRLHHLKRKPPQWGAFFAAAAADPPLAEGLRRVLELLDAHDVVFLTGRPERLRGVTQAWLEQHGLGGLPLYMRGRSDFRPARKTKAEQLRRLASDREVAIVLDDDPDVIDALRADGWPTELATWVPHERRLHDAQEKEGRT